MCETVFKLSLCDMSELYSLLLEKCDGDIPTIVVVKKMVGIFLGKSHEFYVPRPLRGHGGGVQ